MKKVATAQLLPGMVTCENLYNFHGQLLFAQGSVLTDSIISTLITYGIYSVKVEDITLETRLPDLSVSYFTRLKKTTEYSKFKVKYTDGLTSFQKSVGSIMDKDAPLDIRDVYQNIMGILDSSSTGNGILDMLHNMHEYDDSTFSHSINVSLICNILAKWLRMSESDVELATICGMMHDIGKLRTPWEIISKPGKLSDEEYEIIKKHPSSGYQLLKEQGMELSICNSALMHHERCDGSGYPLGLMGNKINKYAKLVAIADVYDAMTAARVYRGPMCPFKVIELFEEEGLQKYDPQYIMTFLENIVTSYLSTSCRLSNGEEGVIIYINKEKLSRPMVQCGTKYINLLERPELFIDCLI